MKNEISKELYNFLQKEFYYCNHRKYHKYFDEWITAFSGYSLDYIEGFEKQRIGKIENNKIQYYGE